MNLSYEVSTQHHFAQCMQNWWSPVWIAIWIHIAFFVLLGLSMQSKDDPGQPSYGVELWSSRELASPTADNMPQMAPHLQQIVQASEKTPIPVESPTTTTHTATTTITHQVTPHLKTTETPAGVGPNAVDHPIFPHNVSPGAVLASSSYANRIKGRVDKLVVFDRNIEVLETTEIEIYSNSDGVITGILMLKSSGNDAWDTALLEAIKRLQQLPRDVDGTTPPILQLGLNWTN